MCALADKGTKAMHEILKRGKFHNLSISCQLDLFDKVVKPILLYGCELWGLSNCNIIERVHLKYCKLLLNLKSSTPNQGRIQGGGGGGGAHPARPPPPLILEKK